MVNGGCHPSFSTGCPTSKKETAEHILPEKQKIAAAAAVAGDDKEATATVPAITAE